MPMNAPFKQKMQATFHRAWTLRNTPRSTHEHIPLLKERTWTHDTNRLSSNMSSRKETTNRNRFAEGANRKHRKIHFVVSSANRPDEDALRSVFVNSRIAERSAHLRNLISSSPPGISVQEIEINNVEPTAFELYIWWLMVGYFSFPVSEEKRLSWSECRDLITSHILGSRFADVAYQYYILDELERWLRPGQRPDIGILELVFSERGASLQLKNFVIDRMFSEQEDVKEILGFFVRRAEGGQAGEVECARTEDDSRGVEGRIGEWATIPSVPASIITQVPAESIAANSIQNTPVEMLAANSPKTQKLLGPKPIEPSLKAEHPPSIRSSRNTPTSPTSPTAPKHGRKAFEVLGTLPRRTRGSQHLSIAEAEAEGQARSQFLASPRPSVRSHATYPMPHQPAARKALNLHKPLPPLPGQRSSPSPTSNEQSKTAMTTTTAPPSPSSRKPLPSLPPIRRAQTSLPSTVQEPTGAETAPDTHLSTLSPQIPPLPPPPPPLHSHSQNPQPSSESRNEAPPPPPTKVVAVKRKPAPQRGVDFVAQVLPPLSSEPSPREDSRIELMAALQSGYARSGFERMAEGEGGETVELDGREVGGAECTGFGGWVDGGLRREI